METTRKDRFTSVVRTLVRRAEHKSYLSINSICSSAKESIKKLTALNKNRKALPAPNSIEGDDNDFKTTDSILPLISEAHFSD